MSATFELKRVRDQYMWNLRASNGKVILTSERYKTKKSAENGIAAVKKNCKRAGAFDKKTAKDGRVHFSMTSTNGQIIGTSQMYASVSGRNNGIRSIHANAGRAKIVDIT